tara:strand:+ start:291 stop:656 length:366 start_codon:yes stop_codon:yes gene_type:complete
MGKKKILIIDDEEEILEMLKQGLELRSSYEVFIASEKDEYKKLLDEGPFDVIFLDHRMPVIKGANLAADIRNSDGPNQNTIIVFISGNIKEVKTLAESLPLCYFLQKPLILQELYDLLDSF